jgi:uncharacterized membrane protein YphA (DoxX/SURF4 family)
LRLGAGLDSLFQGASVVLLPSAPRIGIWYLGVASIAIGAVLIAGFLTPLISLLATVRSAGAALSLLLLLPHVSGPGIMLAFGTTAMMSAIIFLGPGAYSLDARIFGRREVIIRDMPRVPKTH